MIPFLVDTIMNRETSCLQGRMLVRVNGKGPFVPIEVTCYEGLVTVSLVTTVCTDFKCSYG